MVPSTPPSLVKSARAGLLGQHRGVELEADQRPGARGDVGEALVVLGGHPDDRRRGVVRADRDDRYVGGTPTSPPRRAAAGPTTAPGSRSGGRIDQGSPSRLARSSAHSPVRGVVQPGGRGVGALRADARRSASRSSRSGSSSSVSAASSAAVSGRGDQLVDGVERQLLQAGRRVQLARPRRSRAPSRRHRRCGGPGGCSGLPSSVAVAVEQAVVDRPRVDADAVQRARSGRPHACPSSTSRWMPRTSQKSAPRTGTAPLGKRCSSSSWSVLGADPAGHHPAAGRPEVDRGDPHRLARLIAGRPPPHPRRPGRAGRWCGSSRGRRARRPRWRCSRAAPRA